MARPSNSGRYLMPVSQWQALVLVLFLLSGCNTNLVFDDGDYRPLGDPRSIGRGASCDWTLPDPSRQVSSRHAVVSYRDGRYFLADISSNGTRLAGSGAR